MTDTAAPAPTHWAVLIGINFYVGGNCLKGCVRDVETVKQYLDPAVDITMLTATAPSDANSRHPMENPEFWPTRMKVIERLERVLQNAKRGDFVYIHYSGHGTRMEDSEEYPDPSGSLAFVLFEDNEPGMGYLLGRHLANFFRRMVENGLLVTIVLDCCFSGSVLRAGNVHGADVRAIGYDPAVDSASPHELGTDFFDPRNTLRDSRIPLDQWLVNPDGYTILSACGPHETAREVKLDGGERRGALTYFLMEALNALRKSGVEVTHQSLYQHLRIRFHASLPQQTPMRYGSEKFSFFGKLSIASSTTFVPVFRTADRLCLSAGEAHGVHKGDDFVVYPFNTLEGVTSRPDEASVMVKVDTVQGLTSDLVGIGATSVEQIQTGWKARPVTSISPRKISVRLMGKACQIQDIEVVQQQHFLRLLSDNAGAETCIFHVALNEHEQYEILDGSLEKIIGLPTIPLDTPGAHSWVIDVLHHLATFKYFEGVENRTPSSSFEASFSLLPFNSTDASGTFNVDNGGTWGFAVENHGDKDLYMAIFNFTPSWKITNLVSHAGGGDFQVVQKKDDEIASNKVMLTMEVPESLHDRGEKQCEDIVKVFITSKPTSFPSMVLPDIPLHVQHQGGQARGTDDTLLKFLEGLNIPLRGNGHAVDQEWATRSFIIRTALK